MQESYHYHNQQTQHHHQQPRSSSRLGLKTSGGEIVQVQGGHIVRSTSRKDRHSKVCTAKGPRDRRVRLSAHTAIQFYDVQDRLGYDRPSKAVDWLITKAKTAIDELAELPAWKPTATAGNLVNPNLTSIADFEINPDQRIDFEQHPNDSFVDNPMRSSQRSQDLRLSLQSFQDSVLHNHPHPHPHHHSRQTQQDNNIYFNGPGWSDNQPSGFDRVVSWGGNRNNVSAVSTGFVFGSPASSGLTPTPFLQPLFGETITSELFDNNSQREPLQSSTTPLFRAWIDPLPPFTGGAVDQHPTMAFHRPSNGLGGFSGFHVPARIQGEEEEHDGVSDKPSSASSESHR